MAVNETRLDRLDGEVSKVRADVAGLTEGVKSLANSTDELRGVVLQLANRRDPPPQYAVWIAALVAIGTLGVSWIRPIQEDVAASSEGLRALSGSVGSALRDSARFEERSFANRRDIDILARQAVENESRLARVEALTQRDHETLRDVDQAGSRKWIRKD